MRKLPLMKNLLLSLSTLLTLAVLPSCASTKCCQDAACSADGECCATLMVCPISGQECDTDSPKVEFAGKQVSLCCNKCLAKWNQLDDSGKQAALQKQQKS